MRDGPRRTPDTKWAWCPKCKRQVRVKGQMTLKCNECGTEFRPVAMEEKR